MHGMIKLLLACQFYPKETLILLEKTFCYFWKVPLFPVQCPHGLRKSSLLLFNAHIQFNSIFNIHRALHILRQYHGIVWNMYIPCAVPMGLRLFLIICNFFIAERYETYVSLKTKPSLCSTLQPFVATPSAAQPTPHPQGPHPLLFLPASLLSPQPPTGPSLRSMSMKSTESSSI